jgi:hypothetical protein
MKTHFRPFVQDAVSGMVESGKGFRCERGGEDELVCGELLQKGECFQDVG